MADWTPPPPGDTRHQLPASVLDSIRVPVYLSTACEIAALLDETVSEQPGLTGWANHMHSMCRLNNKYTGSLCICPHHEGGS